MILLVFVNNYLVLLFLQCFNERVAKCGCKSTTFFKTSKLFLLFFRIFFILNPKCFKVCFLQFF